MIIIYHDFYELLPCEECKIEEEGKTMKDENGLEKQRLLIELECIQNRGITIFLEGMPSNPLTVTNVLYVNDNFNFMRDYVTDERGVWTELRFDKIENQ